MLRGIRLAEAEELYVKYTDELSQEVQRFIEAGLAARQQQQLAAKQRQRRTQFAVAAIATLSLVALNIGWIAFSQRLAAQIQALEALDASSEALLLSGQQLEALTEGIKAGRKLQALLRVSWLIGRDRPTIQAKTVSTLQQALSLTQEQNRLLGHHEKVNSVAFNPQNHLLASASDDGTIKLWDDSGRLLQTLSGHGDRVLSIAFSPDGKMLVSGSADKTIKLWQLTQTQAALIHTMPGHADWVTSVSFSPDGKMLASGSRDQTVKLWRSDGTLLQTLTGHRGWVNAVQFSPNGRRLAAGGEDKSIRLWQILSTPIGSAPNGSASPRISLSKILTGHHDRITSLTFSPNSQILVSASGDQTVRLWNLAKGSSQALEGHRDQVNSVSFSPDGQAIASASADQTIKLWNADGSLDKTLLSRSEMLSVSFSSDSQRLASAGVDKTVRLWHRDRASTYGSGIYSAALSSDGKLLAVAGWDGTIQLWRGDATTRQLVKTLKGHSARIASLSLSPDGQILASGSDDKTIKLWNVQ
ncbi:MAG TPA: WD40 repeat domain-containing protein, partial [Candidatus Obscuribacterales bacterium]